MPPDAPDPSPDLPDGAMPDDSTLDVPPTVPSKSVYLAAFAAVVVAGLFGGLIGYGLVDISDESDSGLAAALGAFVGAAVAAAGVGVIAVLVLRAQAEWKRQPRRD
jgi:membrane associated rhomboid family serine protease